MDHRHQLRGSLATRLGPGDVRPAARRGAALGLAWHSAQLGRNVAVATGSEGMPPGGQCILAKHGDPMEEHVLRVKKDAYQHWWDEVG